MASLQNGVDNEPVLAQALGADWVVGALAVRIGSHVTAPGRVGATGPGQILWGPWPSREAAAAGVRRAPLERWTAAMNAAGIPTREVEDIRRELWRKLVINNGVNPLSALTGLDTASLSHHPALGPVVLELMRETVRAAAADEVRLDERDAAEMFELIRGFDPIKTSMLMDREHGRSLEREAICGAVLRRAERLGMAAPYTRTVDAVLQLLQERPFDPAVPASVWRQA